MNNEYGDGPVSDGDANVANREVPRRDHVAEPSPPDTAPTDEPRTLPTTTEFSLPDTPKSKDVHTLADLIRYAYGRAGQRVARAAVSTEVASHLDLEADMLEELRVRARKDTLLRVPWQLMAAVLRERHGERLVERIAEVAAIAISEHPVLAGWSEVSTPAAIPDDSGEQDDVRAAKRTILAALSAARSSEARSRSIDDRESIAAAAALPESAIKTSIGESGQVTSSDLIEFKTNLVNTLAVLFAFQQGWPTHVVADVLYANLWQPLAEAEPDPPVLTLTGSPRPAVAGHVTDVWIDRTQQAHQEAIEARQDADRMNRHATRLQRQIDQMEMERLDLETELERQRAMLEDLGAELAERKRHLAEIRAHASHDYETLRTRAIQRAKRELDLLQEGLHALTRDDPKLHVTRDRLERAMEGLEKEVEHLKGGPGA